MTAPTMWTERDLIQIRGLLVEVLAAGRHDEAELLQRVHAVIHDALLEAETADANDDPEFAAEFDQAIAELDAGQSIPHTLVAREIGLK